MKTHEYQAKEILARFGVPVPRGRVAATAEDAVRIAAELGGNTWVVKAQVHAGGRGKAGGVKLCRSLDDVRGAAGRIIGMCLVSPQTGPEGKIVRRVLVSEASEIAKEFYAGIVLDRKQALPVLMVSAEGGVEIEEVAASHPDKILKQTFSPRTGLHFYQGRILARKLGLSAGAISAMAALLVNMAKAFLETDASLVEVNPLVLTPDGKVLALDAKLSVDDNGLFRHPDIKEYRDLDEEDPQEVWASRYDLSYIKLDGSIGCMVNGAGLAMATLDIIQHWGGRAANFLDVGGGASTEKVTEAFKIILNDPGVKAILVNIFGGIMRCDIIAEGIVAAAKSVALKVPLVVRLEGTNVDKGKALLAASGLQIIQADGLSQAARKAVALARGEKP